MFLFLRLAAFFSLCFLNVWCTVHIQFVLYIVLLGDQDPYGDPDPHWECWSWSRWEKITFKKVKEIYVLTFEGLAVIFEGFSCSLDVLHEGQGKGQIQSCGSGSGYIDSGSGYIESGSGYIESGYGSGSSISSESYSRGLITKNWRKKIQLDFILSFFDQKLQFTYLSQQRTSSTSTKWNFKLFIFLWVICVLH